MVNTKKTRKAIINLIMLLDALLGIIANIGTFVKDVEMNQLCFFLIVCVAIAFMIFTFFDAIVYYIHHKKKIDYHNKNSNKILQYLFNENQIRNKIYKTLLKEALCILFLLILFKVNPNNANNLIGNIKRAAGIENKEIGESTLDVEQGTEEEEDGEDMEKSDFNHQSVSSDTLRDERYRFILDSPDASYTLDYERVQQVFFTTDSDFEELSSDLYTSIILWSEGDKDGVGPLMVFDDLGNTYYDYSRMENAFKNQMKDASYYKYEDEWTRYAPHSMEYDQIIKGREVLNSIEIDGKSGNYQAWWFLANDYQLMALEYEIQTENEEAVLYYYTNSIYCCMEALKYDIPQEEYQKTYHYMVMRYHDIFRIECIISGDFKNRAENIFLILKNEDILWQDE